MARSMPWSNAINKRKCPSYKTEKIDVKAQKKKPGKKGKILSQLQLYFRTYCHEMNVCPLKN